MGKDQSIASLRYRVSSLIEQEARLLSDAFELSRAGGDRRRFDALFAQIQAIQLERNGLKKQIGALLGTQRLHVASEVWRVGVYDYCREVGGDSVRVRVSRGPVGLQVHLPDHANAVSIETLKGTFDGLITLSSISRSALYRECVNLASGSTWSTASACRNTRLPS